MEIQPSEINSLINEKYSHLKIRDGFGYTGEIRTDPKTIIDIIIDLSLNEDKLYNEFGEWIKIVFPDATAKEHILKLKIEADELIENITDKYEYADCILALFGAAYKSGLSYEVLINAIKSKFEINKNRTWRRLEDGTYQHI